MRAIGIVAAAAVWAALVSSATVVPVVLLAGCGTAPRDSPTGIPPEALSTARQAADALTGELASALVTEMGSGGAVRAVEVCSETAQRIADRHSIGGVTVRRVSLKVRNPHDTPDDYERAALEDLDARLDGGSLPEEVAEVITDDSGTSLRYLRPIVVKSICLNCHGDVESMEPEVRAILAERYPEDRAVGYEVGDLRGAVSVTVEL